MADKRVWIEDRNEHAGYREAVAAAKAAKRTPPGRWRVRWIDPQGKEKSKTFAVLGDHRTDRPDTANGFRRKLERELNGDGGAVYVDPSARETKFAEIAASWFAALDVKRSSRATYRSDYDTHIEPRWGEVAIGAVKAADIAVWLNSLKLGGGLTDEDHDRLGASRRRGVYTLMGAILDWAVPDYITANPLDDKKKVKRPKAKKVSDHVYLDYAEVEALADVAAGLLTKYGRPTAGAGAGINGPLIRTLAYTGLRAGEALGLKAGSVDLGSLRIKVVVTLTEDQNTGEMYEGPPKDHESREVPVPASLAAELGPLVRGKAEGAYVFSVDGATPMRLRNWRPREYYAARDRLKMTGRLTVHSLRHTCASLAIREGASVLAVQKLLGHASATETLRTYSHLFDDEVDQVAAALDLGRLRTLTRGEAPEPDRTESVLETPEQQEDRA